MTLVMERQHVLGAADHDSLSTSDSVGLGTSNDTLAIVDEEFTAVGNCSDAVDLILRYAKPHVAAGVAILGIGIGALPLLAVYEKRDCLGALAINDMTYATAEASASGANIFTAEELRARLGALDPGGVAEELRKDIRQVTQESSRELRDMADIEAEVQRLQSWHTKTNAALSRLERRSAMAYLGLPADAEADAVHKSYKQKALAAHPDKGGSEEDFQVLQSMLERLQEESPEEAVDGKRGNLFKDLLKHCERRRENREKGDPEQDDSLSPELKVRQSRLRLHNHVADHWQRALLAKDQLSSGLAGRCQSGPIMALLSKLLGSFALEIDCLPRGAGAAVVAERLFCKFLRQGMEVLAASSLVDATATVAGVALQFTSPLLSKTRKAGPCPKLEGRCRALLNALGVVADAFETFWNQLQEQQTNQSAAEWLGCDEKLSPGEAKGNPTSTNTTSPAAPPAARGPSDAAMPDIGSGQAEADNGCRRSDPQAHEVALLSEENELQVLPPRPDIGGKRAYQQTKEWNKLRAFAVQHRLCVDFNRDSADVRCIAPGRCGFKHACAVCGAEDTGGPGSQYLHHGGWNCLRLQAWLMAHR